MQCGSVQTVQRHVLRPQRVIEAAEVIESTVYPLLLIVSSADVYGPHLHKVRNPSCYVRQPCAESRQNKGDRKSTRLLVY